MDTSTEELQFLLIDASNIEDAEKKAIETLRTYSIPKRNIVNLFEIDL